MDNKRKKADLIDSFCPASSVGEMTGLIPAGLKSEDEIEAYEEIIDFLPPGSVKEK